MPIIKKTKIVRHKVNFDFKKIFTFETCKNPYSHNKIRNIE